MARIKFGALVSHAAGSVGGSTFQRNASGYIIRSKPLPIHQKSSTQLNRRAFMKSCQDAWLILPDETRKQWRQFVEYSHQSINNDSNVMISGYNLYLKYQFCRYLFNLGLLTDFDYIKLPALPSVFNIYRASNSLTLNLDLPVDVSDILFIFSLSNAQRLNSSFSAVNCRFMYFTPAGTNDFQIVNSFVDKFGILPNVGDCLSWSCYFFSVKSPVLSGFQSGTLIVQGSTPSGWVSRSALALNQYSAVGCDGTHYFAMSYHTGANNFAISTDAISWSFGTSGITGTCFAVARLGNNLIAVSADDVNCSAYYSDASGMWHAIASQGSIGWSCIAAGAGVALALSNMSDHVYLGICESITDFVAYELPEYTFFTDICYGSSFFLAVQNNPDLIVKISPAGGGNWSFQNLTSPKSFSKLCFGNGVFVVGGSTSANTIFGVTSDGENWQYSPPCDGYYVAGIAFNGNRFVAIVNSYDFDFVLTSTDGLTWVKESIPVACELRAIFANGSLFVAASYDQNIILTNNS